MDTKKSRKSKALADSSTQLDKDKDNLMDFIESDNITTSNRNKQADSATKDRKTKEAMIKQLDGKIQNVKSDIDKNRDQLHTRVERKKCLFNIFEKENATWTDGQKEVRSRKLETEKRKWIEFARLHRDSALGGMEDEFLLSELSKDGEQQGKTPGGGRKTQGQPSKSMSDQDWEKRFEQLLREDLIDVGRDFYEESILYDDPN